METSSARARAANEMAKNLQERGRAAREVAKSEKEAKATKMAKEMYQKPREAKQAGVVEISEEEQAEMSADEEIKNVFKKIIEKNTKGNVGVLTEEVNAVITPMLEEDIDPRVKELLMDKIGDKIIEKLTDFLNGLKDVKETKGDKAAKLEEVNKMIDAAVSEIRKMVKDNVRKAEDQYYLNKVTEEIAEI